MTGYRYPTDNEELLRQTLKELYEGPNPAAPLPGQMTFVAAALRLQKHVKERAPWDIATTKRLRDAVNADPWYGDALYKAFDDINQLIFMNELKGHIKLKWIFDSQNKEIPIPAFTEPYTANQNPVPISLNGGNGVANAFANREIMWATFLGGLTNGWSPLSAD